MAQDVVSHSLDGKESTGVVTQQDPSVAHLFEKNFSFRPKELDHFLLLVTHPLGEYGSHYVQGVKEQ
jgi:hypothetical protein